MNILKVYRFERFNRLAYWDRGNTIVRYKLYSFERSVLVWLALKNAVQTHGGLP